MAFETILYENSGGIAQVTMNRPDRLNAMTWRMIEEFLEVADACGRDDDVRIVDHAGLAPKRIVPRRTYVAPSSTAIS